MSAAKLKRTEELYFDALFKYLDTDNAGALKGAVVAKLYTTSGLDKTVLAEIWKIASGGVKGPLSKDGFFTGCRLVALAQSGAQVSSAALASAVEIPLPKFAGPEVEAMLQNAIREATPPAPAPAPVATSPAVSSPASQTGSWAVTEQDRIGYLNFFGVADQDGDKFVNGKEAKTFFSKSGLPPAVLKDIWNLSDADGDHKLDEKEFITAMHLIMKYRANPTAGVPSTLPPELKASVYGTPAPAPIVSPAKELPKDEFKEPAPSLSGIGKKAIPDDLLAGLGINLSSDPTPDLLSSDLLGPSVVNPPLSKKDKDMDLLGSMVTAPKSNEPAAVAPQSASHKPADLSMGLGATSFGMSSISPVMDPNASAEVDRLKHEVQSKKQALEHTKFEAEKMRREKLKLAEQAEFLQAQLDALQGQLDDYDRMLSENKFELDNEREKVEEIKTQIDSVKAEVNNRMGMLSDNKRTISSLREEKRRLEREYEDIKQEIQDEELRMNEVSREQGNIENRIAEFKTMIGNQKQILEAKREQRDLVEKEKAGLSERQRAAAFELKRLKEEANAITLEISEITKLSDEVKEQLQVTESLVADAKKANAAAKAAVPAKPVASIPSKVEDKSKPKSKPEDLGFDNPFDGNEEWPEFDFDDGSKKPVVDSTPAKVQATSSTSSQPSTTSAKPAESKVVSPVPAKVETPPVQAVSPVPAPTSSKVSKPPVVTEEPGFDAKFDDGDFPSFDDAPPVKPAAVPASSNPKVSSPTPAPSSAKPIQTQPVKEEPSFDANFGADDFPSFDDAPPSKPVEASKNTAPTSDSPTIPKTTSPAPSKAAPAPSDEPAFDANFEADDFPSFDDAPPAKPVAASSPLPAAGSPAKPANAIESSPASKPTVNPAPLAAPKTDAAPRKGSDDPFGNFGEPTEFKADFPAGDDDWNF
jgi:hypothetical protein